MDLRQFVVKFVSLCVGVYNDLPFAPAKLAYVRRGTQLVELKEICLDKRQPGEKVSMKAGLYQPDEFKDNCGFGLIAHMQGEPSHTLCKRPLRP